MSNKFRRPVFLALTALCLSAFGCDDSSNDGTVSNNDGAVSEKEQTCISNGGKEYNDKEDKCYCQVDGKLVELVSGNCSDLAIAGGDCKDGDAPKCDSDFILTCTDKKWQKAETKCEYGCKDGVCRDKNDPPLETCTDGATKCVDNFVSTCTEGVWVKASDACPNGCDKGVCMEEAAGSCTDGDQRCSDDYVQKCFNKQWVNASLKCPDGCEKNECKGDLNHNYMKDEFDLKDGKECSKYSDCGSGFCDSFIGYKCSNKCTDDSQCISDSYYCRKDGRCAPKEFVTEWKVASLWDPQSKNVEFTFPLKEASVCKFKINWGDNNAEDVTSCKDVKHVYAEPGTYRITISGTLEGGYLRQNSNDQELLRVISFGPAGLGKEAFKNAEALTDVSHIDIPDASKFTDASEMFWFDDKFNSDISYWDMSNVTSVSWMFNNAKSFNQPVGKWDTSNFVKMDHVFSDAAVFNQDLSHWDTSNAENMNNMFENAVLFNQPIGNWNTSKVTQMREMFSGAEAFDQNIGDWDLSQVYTTVQMFAGAKQFNQDISKWKLDKIRFMSGMFKDAAKFNQNIGSWNVSNAEDIDEMFKNNPVFNQNIGGWDVSKVRSIKEMFYQAGAFDQDLSTWKLTNLSSKNSAEGVFTGSKLSKENYCKLMSGSADAKWKEYIDILGLKDKYTCD